MTLGEFQAAARKWRLKGNWRDRKHDVTALAGRNKSFAEHQCKRYLAEAAWLADIAGLPLNDIAVDLDRELTPDVVERKRC